MSQTAASASTAQAMMLASINPATGEVVGEVPVTPVGRIGHIVERARTGQHAWGQMSLQQRAATLEPVGALLEKHAEEFGKLITMEMGKPLKEGIGEVRACAHEWKAGLDEIAEALKPVELIDDGVKTTLYRDPFGIAAAITPWNFPILMPHQQVLPALVAGNAVVFKPSEQTPLIGQAYADLLIECLPSEVLHVIHGADAQGAALVAADVDLITFTGSREVGKKILAAASEGLKRVILELGGKDPLIVLDDGDIQAAAKLAARNSFRNAGQVCVSTERIYVQEQALPAFVKALVEEAKAYQPGNGLEESSTIGPMVNTQQRDHVLKQIAEAVSGGARVVYGGEGHHGNFVMPTVLTEVNDDMAVARDETFGPVAAILTFENDAEAVRRANASPYALGAIVFGEEDHARRVARHLSAGMIGVNRGIGGAHGSPWVGAKQSGYGFHSGPEGHRQFAQVRMVSTRD